MREMVKHQHILAKQFYTFLDSGLISENIMEKGEMKKSPFPKLSSVCKIILEFYKINVTYFPSENVKADDN